MSTQSIWVVMRCTAGEKVDISIMARALSQGYFKCVLLIPMTTSGLGKLFWHIRMNFVSICYNDLHDVHLPLRCIVTSPSCAAARLE
jgi:hypothetical protein